MLHKSIPNGGRITCHIIPTHCDGLLPSPRTTWPCSCATRPPRSSLCCRPAVAAAHAHGLQNQRRRLASTAWRNRYVVVRCFYCKSHNDPPVYNIGHEIFTLDTGAGDGWQRMQDQSQEAFDAVPSSLGCTACDNNNRLADLTGELCYVHRVRTSVATHEVWMAAAVDDDDQEWWLRYRVDL
uniref:Uncharacterized protein n=1 Tax=Oryza nivara TaxID=4536 RepID=A0A0E0HL51_ORYNI